MKPFALVRVRRSPAPGRLRGVVLRGRARLQLAEAGGEEPVENPDVSGALAYNRRYGFVAVRSVMMLGGVPAYAGRTGAMVVAPQVQTAAAGDWDTIAVLRALALRHDPWAPARRALP